MISIKSLSDSDGGEKQCFNSISTEEFKKCTANLRLPFIHKLHLASYKQFYDFDYFGYNDFIILGEDSINAQLQRIFELNKVGLLR